MCEEKRINEAQQQIQNNSENSNKINQREEISQVNQNELSEENKQLKEKIAELENQLKEIQNAARIIKAAFENYKLDVDRQIREATKSTALRIVKALIPILDDFKRAFKYYESDKDLEKFKLGVEKIYEKLLKTLENEGLRIIDASGKFDPFNHEAFEKEERDDVEEYTILEVIEDGYTFNGQVVKPTKVRVAIKPRKKEENTKDNAANDQQNG
ncbi:nucleotide exchange factor GrpE [Fervidobacterium pennivorans subsp. shakshaketiis]|jgi:molecular chaperone GrpE|uniref:nucleotide exchange factor GrpE n=1 Tax=Fervidobacterium pennivorans TaxID=93466 RepID=UPI00201B8023|nr:nucleotide exchange factor GrpE [Fervidobacterium pennivorans]